MSLIRVFQFGVGVGQFVVSISAMGERTTFDLVAAFWAILGFASILDSTRVYPQFAFPLHVKFLAIYGIRFFVQITFAETAIIPFADYGLTPALIFSIVACLPSAIQVALTCSDDSPVSNS